MKKLVAVILMSIFLVMAVGCSAHIHKVGNGAQSSQVDEARQWYILWGLVPLNEVNTDQMAAGSTDYTIETEQTVLDFVMNIFTGIITVNSRTVTVTK